MNEDSEDSWGVSFLLPSNHSKSYLSIWVRDRADISGGKFACFEGEENSLRKIFLATLNFRCIFFTFFKSKKFQKIVSCKL